MSKWQIQGSDTMEIDIMDLTMAIMGIGLGFLFISCGIWILCSLI